MKRILMMGLAATSLALTACGGSDEAPEAPQSEAPAGKAQQAAPAQEGQPKTEAQQEAERQVFHDSIEKAMADIPPEHRDQFQKLFSCEIEKNSRRDTPQEINAATIRALTAQLEKNPRAGDACAA